MGFSYKPIDVSSPKADSYSSNNSTSGGFSISNYQSEGLTFGEDFNISSEDGKITIEDVDVSPVKEKVQETTEKLIDSAESTKPKVEEITEPISNAVEDTTEQAKEVEMEVKSQEDTSSKDYDLDLDEILKKNQEAKEKLDFSEVETEELKVENTNKKQNEFVNYYQYNYDQPYSQGTIATSGCGPTSVAMALTYITGKEITPVETAEFGNGTYTCSEGTMWTFFKDVSAKYGVDCEQHEVSVDNIKEGLKNGNPVVISMGPGHFTKAGHFIVLRGIDENGKVIVADPASEERTNQTWDMDIITSEGKQIWTFPE